MITDKDAKDFQKMVDKLEKQNKKDIFILLHYHFLTIYNYQILYSILNISQKRLQNDKCYLSHIYFRIYNQINISIFL